MKTISDTLARYNDKTNTQITDTSSGLTLDEPEKKYEAFLDEKRSDTLPHPYNTYTSLGISSTTLIIIVIVVIFCIWNKKKLKYIKNVTYDINHELETILHQPKLEIKPDVNDERNGTDNEEKQEP